MELNNKHYMDDAKVNLQTVQITQIHKNLNLDEP